MHMGIIMDIMAFMFVIVRFLLAQLMGKAYHTLRTLVKSFTGTIRYFHCISAVLAGNVRLLRNGRPYAPGDGMTAGVAVGARVGVGLGATVGVAVGARVGVASSCA